MKKKNNYYKLVLLLFFLIIIAVVFYKGKENVSADDDDIDIVDDALLYTKTGKFKSGQATTSTRDGSVLFVFYNQDNSYQGGEYDPIPGTYEEYRTTLLVFGKQSDGSYKKIKEINNIDCGHVNGAAYYEENGNKYLLVTVKDDYVENVPSIIKYQLSSDYSISKAGEYYLGRRINALTWDYDRNKIIVSINEKDDRVLLSFDTNFITFSLIRKLNTVGASRTNGVLGYFYNTQGITYYNNKIYLAIHLSSESLCRDFYPGMGFNTNLCTGMGTKKDSYLTVIDARTGDFSKLLFISGDNIGEKLKQYNASGNNEPTNDMRELEDLIFINGKMYLCFQKGGRYVIIRVSTSDDKVFGYNKLYATYNLNGGQLASQHGDNISQSGNLILVDGNSAIEIGKTGEYLKSGGLDNYNEPGGINIIKPGYHLNSGAEWKNANNNEVYGQDTEYKVSELKDITISSDSISLIANWVVNTYKVQLVPNGGNGSVINVTNSLKYNDSITLPDNPFTRPGYKFVVWNTKSNGTGANYLNGETVRNLTTENNVTVSLYAIWTPINYILKLVTNNGTGLYMNFTLTYDQIFYLSTLMPSRPGYTLAGWSTSPSATSPQYSPTQPVSKLGTSENQVITLYAVWTVDNYTVTFDSTGGSGVPSITRQYGKTLGTLPTPTKIGYTFKGWFTEPSGGTQVNASTVVKGNVTYYAQWTPIKYYLKLVNNDGTATNRNIQLEYGTGYSLSNYQPARSGYTLAGWSTSSTATSPQYSSTQTVTNLTSNPNQTVTLYAVWRVRTYTISFNSSGGSNVASIAREHGKPLGTLPTTTKTGYSLKGWFTEPTNGTQVSASTTVVGNATYYAQWTPINYTVSFNANGGTGTMTSVSMKYGNTYTLQANNFERSGYIFNGWNTKPDGTGSNYSNRQQVSNLTTTANATVTLYAKWVVDSGYRINYDLDGGTVSINNPVNYDSTTPTFKLNNPSKEGYTFKGWTGSNGTTPQLEVNIVQGTTGNLNYKANYEAITYTLTFETGTDAQTLELEYGSEVTQLPSVIKKGYTLLGWYDEEGEFLGETVGVGDKVYNPEFRPNKYTIKYDSNGGEGTMNDQIMEYDQKDAVLNNLFTKSNESFVEWNTKKDSTGQSYKNSDEILNLTDQDNEEIVLYAIWQLSDLPDGGGSHGLEDPKNDQDNTSGNKKNNSVNPKTGATLSIGIIVLLSIIGFILYKFSSKKSLFRKI